MEAIENEEFLPLVADQVAIWFPSLAGRSVAVSEGDITKENRPSLPFSLCALNREEGTNFNSATLGNENITEDFIIEFWLKAKRFDLDSSDLTRQGLEPPFWSYYAYKKHRDTLVTKFFKWIIANPSLGSIAYVSMDIAADPQAVILTYRFRRTYIWCPLVDESDEEIPYIISAKTKQVIC